MLMMLAGLGSATTGLMLLFMEFWQRMEGHLGLVRGANDQAADARPDFDRGGLMLRGDG